MRLFLAFVFVIAVAAGGTYLYFDKTGDIEAVASSASTETKTAKTEEVVVPEEASSVVVPVENAPAAEPVSAFIALPKYVSQTFNNCSMAAFSMLLSHYGVDKSQAELAERIRPWNNPRGDNDDKSTVFEEIEPLAIEYGFTPYYRPNGRPELLQAFVANDIPVMVRTLTKPYEDYLHFRVVVGYDATRDEFIVDDSMQGKGLRFSPEAFDSVWREFNYQYMVLAKTPAQAQAIESILGEETDRQAAWQNALERAQAVAAQNPNDLKARYNVLTARFYLGQFEQVVKDFEAIEPQLSKYKLWYQIEPIEAYFKLGNYDRVIELADRVLTSNNKAVSELYLMKGNIYQSRGDMSAATAEYEKAVLYNKNWNPAQEALAALQ